MSRPIDALLGNIDPLTGLRRGMVGGNASYMQSPVKVTALPQIGNNTAYNTGVTMRSGNNIPVRPMTNAGVIAGTPFKNNTPTLLTGTTTGQTNTGLLGDTFNDPRTVGALNSASELMKLGGYSVGKPAPTLGQSIGVGIQSYLKGKQAEEDRQTNKSQSLLKNQLAMAQYINDLQKMQLDISKTKKEDAKTAFGQEKNLRDSFIKESKVNTEAIKGFNKVARASTSTPSGANDVALVFGFMKTIDPNSVVREGEFATAENTGGVESRIRSLYNKLLTGQRLTPKQRSNFLESAKQQVQQYIFAQEQLESSYTNLSKSYSLDPSKVVSSKLPISGSYLKPISVSSLKDAEKRLKNGQYFILDGQIGVID